MHVIATGQTMTGGEGGPEWRVCLQAAFHPTTRAVAIASRFLPLRRTARADETKKRLVAALLVGLPPLHGEALVHKEISVEDTYYFFPVTSYDGVVSRIRSAFPTECVIAECPTMIRDLWSGRLKTAGWVPSGPLLTATEAAAAAVAAANRVPVRADPLFRGLYEYQKVGAEFIIHTREGRGMICDEMGLGKTAQAIAIAHFYRDEWPVLVVCPASLCANWRNEFIRWCQIPASRIDLLTGSTKQAPNPEACIVICSYTCLECLSNTPALGGTESGVGAKRRRTQQPMLPAMLRQHSSNGALDEGDVNFPQPLPCDAPPAGAATAAAPAKGRRSAKRARLEETQAPNLLNTLLEATRENDAEVAESLFGVEGAEMDGADGLPVHDEAVVAPPVTSAQTVGGARLVGGPRTFRVVIVDECHNIKTHGAERSTLTLDLCSHARRVVMVSGTPALSRPAELFTQLRAVCPVLFNRPRDFDVRYCNAGPGKFAPWTNSGASNLLELEYLLSQFIIRRDKRTVLGDLPPKTREVKRVTVTMEEVRNHSGAAAEVAAALERHLAARLPIERFPEQGILQMYPVTGSAKRRAVQDYVRAVLEEYIRNNWGMPSVAALATETATAAAVPLSGGADVIDTPAPRSPRSVSPATKRKPRASVKGGATTGATPATATDGCAPSASPSFCGVDIDAMLGLTPAASAAAASRAAVPGAPVAVTPMRRRISGGRAASEAAASAAAAETAVQPDKMLLFAHHEAMMSALRDTVVAMTPARPLDYIFIDGSTKASDRSEQVAHFQRNPNCRIAILSMQAAGVGLTLTAANRVVFAELAWNPATLMQCEDRVHRIGQRKPCLIEYLVASGTVDDYLWKMISAKIAVTGGMLNETHHREAFGEASRAVTKLSRTDVSVNALTTSPGAGHRVGGAGGGNSGGGHGYGGPAPLPPGQQTLDGWKRRDAFAPSPPLTSPTTTTAGVPTATITAAAAFSTRLDSDSDVVCVGVKNPHPLPQHPLSTPHVPAVPANRQPQQTYQQQPLRFTPPLRTPMLLPAATAIPPTLSPPSQQQQQQQQSQQPRSFIRDVSNVDAGFVAVSTGPAPSLSTPIIYPPRSVPQSQATSPPRGPMTTTQDFASYVARFGAPLRNVDGAIPSMAVSSPPPPPMIGRLAGRGPSSSAPPMSVPPVIAAASAPPAGNRSPPRSAVTPPLAMTSGPPTGQYQPNVAWSPPPTHVLSATAHSSPVPVATPAVAAVATPASFTAVGPPLVGRRTPVIWKVSSVPSATADSSGA